MATGDVNKVEVILYLSWFLYELAVAEWLARLLHMQEAWGSNAGLGMLSFSCHILKNLTKSGYWRCKQRSAVLLLLRLSANTLYQSLNRGIR